MAVTEQPTPRGASRTAAAGSTAPGRPRPDLGVQDVVDDATRVSVPVSGGARPGDSAALQLDDDLDERKRLVLRAIVSEHVAHGEPVGSKRVVEVARLDVSAATVRNEMVALERLGYITQPHTSAGRIPTDKGYRRFVDDLRADASVSGQHRELVEELLGSATDVEDLLARTSSVLSQLTRLVSLVIAPAVETARLKLVELVCLAPGSALLLMVADTGRVEKRSVELPPNTTEADLDRVRSVLAEHVRGRELGKVHGALSAIADEAPADLREVLRALADATAAGIADDTVHHVYVGGQASLAGDASFEREHLSRLLELLEERATLARLVADVTADDEPIVRIGEENEVEDLRAASLVAQRYQLVTAGSLGVLGPTRMDYGSVLSTVRAVVEQLQQSLTDLSN
ncbi:MAG: heat-inducible transcriptional repressor HrcA [Nitriliruptoraceae bacterium]